MLCVECENGVIGNESILPTLAQDCTDLIARLVELPPGARGGSEGDTPPPTTSWIRLS